MSPSLRSISKRYQYLSALVFIAICCLFAACETDDMDHPPKIVIPHGLASFIVESKEQNVQTIGVKVLDKDSLPKSGVKVYFKVRKGRATFADSVAVTDADGVASVSLTLGTQSGDIILSAQAAPLIEFPVFFTFQVVSSLPATIDVLSGDNQEALENTRLARELFVIVKDRFGNPVFDGEVTFSITSGNGTLSTNTATVSNGMAYVQFTTGINQPVSTVQASMGGGLKTVFTIFTLLPVQLSVTTNEQKNIQVTWTKGQSPNFKSYSLYRSRRGFSDDKKLTEFTNVDVTTFEDTETNLGMVYSYYIRVDTKLGDYVESMSESGESGNAIKLPNADGIDYAFDTENGLIYLPGYYSEKVLIFSARTFQKVDSIMLTGYPYRITLSNDFSRLYVVYSGAQSFDIFQVSTKSRLKTVDVSQHLSAPITDLYMAKNNMLFAVGDWVVKIDEASNYAQQKVGNTTMSMLGLPRFVGDHDSYLYLEEGNYTPNSLYKLDMSQPTIPQVLEDAHASVQGTKNCILSPDGTRLYLAGQVVNTNNFTVTATLPETSYAQALSADGQQLYTSTFKTYATGSLKTLDAFTLATKEERTVGFLASRLFIYNNALYVLAELQSPNGTWRFYKIEISE